MKYVLFIECSITKKKQMYEITVWWNGWAVCDLVSTPFCYVLNTRFVNIKKIYAWVLFLLFYTIIFVSLFQEITETTERILSWFLFWNSQEKKQNIEFIWKLCKFLFIDNSWLTKRKTWILSEITNDIYFFEQYFLL